MTTALLMCAVTMAVGKGKMKFITLSCINIVVAANAGGAYSPFGDITTLMVWQKQKLEFFNFFDIFLPSAVNYLIPAIIMHFSVPKGAPDVEVDNVQMKFGAKRIIFLFFATITLTVALHNYFQMPPVLGMITGLAFLQFFAYYLKLVEPRRMNFQQAGEYTPFNIFEHIARSEWDTLLFFYGVLMCVGGLSFFGYLHLASVHLYGHLSHTLANTIIGVLSAIIDNIPIMYAVLTMNPPLDEGQWLLITLTAGVGGSILSIGSAAGVALMGQARGIYTFFGHLKWAWAVGLGYIGAIAVHILVNHDAFTHGVWVSGLNLN
jgi:Na+/H+ antiporter NhaD/arsenite permease-like protein